MTRMTVPHSSRRAREIQESPIRKLAPLADAATAKGTRIFHLNIGQPDIPTPPDYWSAITSQLPPVLAYGPSNGLPDLRKAISGYYGRAGIDVAPEEVLITTGGSEAVVFAMMAVCDEGDEVVCFEPFYTNYNGFATMAGVRLVPVTSSPDDGFHLPDDEAIESRIGDRTRALLICNPNNPTGTVLKREEVERLAEIAKRRNLFLLADEVYRDFVFDGRSHASVLEVSGCKDSVIVMDSISKRFSSCGARLGDMVVRNPELMAGILKFAQARLCPPTLAQFGAIYMYDHLGEDYFSGVTSTYQSRRDVLLECLSGVEGVFFQKPEGAFYAMVGLPVDDTDDFAAWLLRDFSDAGETTMVAPGAGFYATPGLGKNEIRIAYVLEEARMRRALEILGRGLAAYGA
ncbi:pyridoxal phosphate-dependent aminotransferase [Candidatus Fermentibacterales bacterium]|nr:pyridoxal phosphate-dependent aminotransferase [Candidatus Fermentibacterales bacterium]